MLRERLEDEALCVLGTLALTELHPKPFPNTLNSCFVGSEGTALIKTVSTNYVEGDLRPCLIIGMQFKGIVTRKLRKGFLGVA